MFDWDEGNISKNFLKHGVTNENVEGVFGLRPLLILPDTKHSVYETRKLLLGVTDSGRKLSIVFTIRSGKIRIISARNMSRKEVRFYEEKSKTDTKI